MSQAGGSRPEGISVPAHRGNVYLGTFRFQEISGGGCENDIHILVLRGGRHILRVVVSRRPEPTNLSRSRMTIISTIREPKTTPMPMIVSRIPGMNVSTEKSLF